jgi:WD40 repeat protein
MGSAMARDGNPGEAGQALPEGLLGLHAALQRDGFVVGPGDLLAATRLVARLAATGRLPSELDGLEPLLRAVYCKSEPEQARFGQVFRGWRDGWARSGDRPPPPEPEPDKTKTPVAPPTVDPPPNRPGRLPALCIGLAAVIVVLVLLLRPQAGGEGSTPPPPTAQAPAPTNAAAASPAAPADKPGTTVAPADPGTRGLIGYVPQQRVQREFRDWLVWVLLALPLPLLLLLFAPALALSRRRKDQARRGSGLPLDVSSWRHEAERIVPAMNPTTAARLDRHVRPDFDEDSFAGRRALDMRRTLASTLRNQGLLSPRWRPRRARPSYLVLLDLRDEQDLRGRLFFRWAERLRNSGVAVDVWLYDGDPRTLYPAEQRRLFDSAGRARNGVPLQQVADRAAGESVRRLVVVTDAQALFGADGQLHDWWTQLGWQRWPQRVLFTPVDPRDWGPRELALEQPLARGDPGFLVLPLEQEALDAYAVQVTAGTLPSIVLTGARRYPPLLEQRPELALATEAPDEADVDRLIAQLRLYLGENGLRWLAACAVPPLTRWELTLLIGQALFRDMGADSEESLRWLMSTNYPRIARLPWLRQASLPTWLALRLLQELSPTVQQRIRAVVGGLLESVPTERLARGDDVLMLDCTPPSAAAGAPLPAGQPAADGDTHREQREWLYLGFLDGLSPRQLAMRAPPSWRQWFGRPKSTPQRTLRDRLLFTLDWLRAFAARLMWRDGRAEGGASPTPLVMAAAWMVGVCAVLAWVAWHADGHAPRALVDLLMHEQRVGGGVRFETQLSDFGFTADGRGFYTVDDDHLFRLHDLQGRAIAPTLPLGRSGRVHHVDSDGRRVLAYTMSDGVALWGLRGERWERRERAFIWSSLTDRGVTSPDGRWLATWGSNERLWVFDVGTARAAGSGGPVPAAGDVAFIDARTLLVLRDDGFAALRLPELQQGSSRIDRPELQQVWRLDLPGVQASWWSEDRKQVVTLTGNTLQLWSVGAAMDTPTWVLPVNPPSRPRVVAIGANAIGLVGTDAPDTLRLLQWTGPGRPPVETATVKARQGRIVQAAFAGGGTALVVGDEGPLISVYDLERRADATTTLLPLGAPLKHTNPVQGFRVSREGDLLLTSTRGKTRTHSLRVWQGARLQPGAPLEGDAGDWMHMAVSADGRLAAALADDGRARVWSADSGREVARFKLDSTGRARLFEFIGPSPMLAVGDANAVRLVDPTSGEERARLAAGSNAAFVAASTRLMTSSAGRARLWTRSGADLKSGAELDVGQARSVDVNPTADELLVADGDSRTLRLVSGTDQRTLQPLGEALVDAPPVPVTLPDVVALALPEARARLLTLGVGVQWSAADRDASGARVRRMQPTPGSRVLPGSSVTLVLDDPAAGKAAPREPCIDGYVLREAFAGDTVCVTPRTRDLTLKANMERRARVDLKSQAFGPETCRQGFVWREADRYISGERFTDKTCVSPAERALAAEDNAQRTQRARVVAPPPRTRPWAEMPSVAASPREPDRLQRASYVDGGRLLLAQGSSHVRLFDTGSLAPASPPVRALGLTAATYWPQGGLLVTTAADGVLRFWDVGTGSESAPPVRTGVTIGALSMAPDGQRLRVVDRRSGAVSLWDLASRRPLPLPVGVDPASIVFSADGSRLAGLAGRTPQTFRLPQAEPASLRSVSTHATLWLVVLSGALALTVGMFVTMTRRRAQQLLRLSQPPSPQPAGASA